MRGFLFMKSVIKTVCVIIGTVIGAGFASGKEIYLFFCSYGLYGFFGLIISSILTGLIVYKVLIQLRGKNINGYGEYLEILGISRKAKEVLNIIINIFLLISFYVMIAGFCAYFKQEFNVSPILTGIIVCIMCHFTFMNRIEGVTKMNTIVIPFLILIILIIGAKSDLSIIPSNVMQTEENVGNWFIASLEYASYNSIILIPMLIGLKDNTKGKEKIIGIIVSIFFFILALILYVILLQQGLEIQTVELPLIYAVNKLGKIYPYIYGIVIILAIYTTAIAAGYGFIENCSKTKKSYKNLSISICVSAIFVSRIGFSKLVNLLYPVFGLIGLAQVIIICLKRTKSIEKKDEN